MPKDSSLKRDRLSRSAWPVIFFMLVIFASASYTFAHRVMLFVYVEGDRIFTESYFSDGKRCQNSRIEVFDSFGKKLLEGKTNKDGEFSFKSPKRTGLKIVLTAGMGHKDEYVLPAGELPDVAEGRAWKYEPHQTEKKVFQARKGGVSFIQVMGGIGFIFGIMGIILYFRSRRGR